MAVADLRESWAPWAGVCLTFVAVNFSLCLASLFFVSAADGDFSHDPSGEGQSVLMANAGLNMAVCVLVGLSMVAASTALVVRARRGALARLALAGAEPGQVTRFMVVQLAVVALVSSVIGTLIAVPMLRPSLDAVAADRGFPSPAPEYSLWTMIQVALACVVVAVLGGLGKARAAGKLPPVEALREAAGAPERRTPVWRIAVRVLMVLLGVAVVVGLWFAIQAAARSHEHSGGSMVMQLSVLSLAVAGMTLAAAAPLLVPGMARLLARLLPVPDASWHLASNVVVAKSDRLVRTVTAMMFAVGLMCGFEGFGATMQASLDAANSGVHLEGLSVVASLTLVLLPLVVAGAGAVGNLIMMSRQRDAELALSGIVGATPAQQVLVPVFEAVFLTLIASVLGLVMAFVGTGFVWKGMDEYSMGRAVFSFPPLLLAGVIAVCFLVCVAATTLPALRSLRQPAPRVIARLVAE